MPCPNSFGSSSDTSLWYAVEPDAAAAIPATFTWYGVPMTGESLQAQLTASISEQITSKRSYAGSVLTQGELGGGVNFEAQAGQFFYNMLLSVLQSSQPLSFGPDLVAGTDAATINAVGGTVNASRTINLTGVTAIQGATYTVIIDGKDFNFVAGAAPTTTTIATGLTALIAADTRFTATSATATITISAGAGLSVITFTSTPVASWAPGEATVNGSTKNCFVFLKRIQVGVDKFDYYAFRAMQVSSMALEITTDGLVTGALSFMGTKPDAPLENVSKPAGWTFVDAPSLPVMAGVTALRDFAIQNEAGVSLGVTMQSLSLTIDNQLRQQRALNTGTAFASGVGSGRIMATFSGAAYYASPKIYNTFLADTSLKIVGKLLDSSNDGIQFLADYVKVTSGGQPVAESGDQDLIINTEFRAFESAANGTLKLTKLAG